MPLSLLMASAGTGRFCEQRRRKMVRRIILSLALAGLAACISSLTNRPSMYRSRPVDAIRPLAFMVAPLVMI